MATESFTRGHGTMANTQLTVPLTTQERRTLFSIAEAECREPVAQLRYMLRTEAQRRGLIECSNVRVNLNEEAAFGVMSTRETTTTQP